MHQRSIKIKQENMPRLHILKGFSDLDSALWVLKYHPGLRTRSEMVRTAVENGYTVANKDYEIILLLREWGLVERKQSKLTSKGNDFYSLWEKNPNVAIDVLHGLQYGLWTQHSPAKHLASWTYQGICDYLWEYQTLSQTQNLVTHIYDNLYESLSDWNNSQLDIGNTAFDSKSVNGAYDWLLPLSPPVLEGVGETAKGKNFRNATFIRRTYCSPALFLMGLSWVTRESGNEFGALVAIDEERRYKVCRFCLIAESRFEFMLNETLRRFSYYISSVERTVGLYVAIEREPQFADF
jgi:hypothetical protein